MAFYTILDTRPDFLFDEVGRARKAMTVTVRVEEFNTAVEIGVFSTDPAELDRKVREWIAWRRSINELGQEE